MGAQAATLDIEGAYRTVPIQPNHKAYVIVEFEGLFYMDHNVPFGLASAAGLQGEVADATVDIWRHLGVGPVKKWVDDFDVFRFPVEHGPFVGTSDGIIYHYSYDLTSIKQLIAPLQIPWHKDKGQEFGDSFVYVGFLWDLPSRTVRLPERKRLKLISKLTRFVDTYAHSQVPKNELESVCGSLSHVSFVYTRGNSYLSNLYICLSSFSNVFSPRFLSHSAISDLRWWLQQLQVLGIFRSLAPIGPVRDFNIWVDASSDWGVGILWNGRWAAWRTVPGWRGDSRDIGWLEAIAIEIAISVTQMMGVSNSAFLIRSDNEGSIGAYNKGRGRNWMTNLSVRRSEEVLSAAALTPSLLYVNTSINLADVVSRGSLPPDSLRIPFPIHLPPSIAPFFVNV